MLDVLAGVRLDHGSPVPLYHQAAQALEAAIEDGRLPRGSKLGGEVDLAVQFGISRPTMRAAMKQLADKGLIIRRRGIGTIVAPRPVRRAVALTSLYDDLAKAGRDPRTRVLSLKKMGAPPVIAEALGLGPGEEVIRIERLRSAGSDPVALMRNAVPEGLLEITADDLESGGLYELLRRNGAGPHIAIQHVGARKADGEEAELLEIEPGDPLLTMSRTAYDTEGRAVEYGWHSYPAEAYSFEMMLSDL